ncbi:MULTISPECIES: DNRLRE domain-containing protein [unclassified Micromonospora]|uniref:DNRLRE domain-containing protein n=2 Tax=Micromonospora TaxID=1873 RepID=UPI0033275C30
MHAGPESSVVIRRIGDLVRGRYGQALIVFLTVVLVATLAEWGARRPAVAAPPSATQATPTVLERPDETAALITARMTGKRVLITGLTSETSQFWALPSGAVTAEIAAGPVRMRNGTGGWTDVDLTLHRRGDGSVAPIAHPYGLTFSGAAGAGEHALVTLGATGNRATLGWTGALPEPVLDGNRATYPDVRPGVDLEVTATRTGYQQLLIVKDRAAAAQVRRIRLPWRTEGATARTDGAGGLEIRNRSGKRIGSVGAPLMWDAAVDPASGEHRRRAPVGLRLDGQGDRTGLVLEPDQDFLADPATSYPVTIDPSQSIGANFDAFVQSSFTSDQSAATELKLGTYDGGTTKARSFLRFDSVNTWLWDKQVQSATLSLWEFHSYSCTARSWEAWRVGAVSTATRWTAQPTWDAKVGTSTETKGYSTTCGDGWVNVTVADAFQHAADAHSTSVNIGIRATSETDNYSWKRFNSREAAANPPKLSITYQSKPVVSALATVPTTVCATGTGRPYVNSRTPQLRAKITDGESSPVRARFEWQTSAGALLGSSVVGPGASGSWLAATVPSGAFAEGGTYRWRARGNDGTVDGPWSATCEFTVDTTAPSAAPTVSSTSYPAGQWGGAAGTAGTFTFGASGVTDVAAYEYGLNVNPPNLSVNAPSLGAGASVSITPSADGPQTLYVRSRDRAGNQSAIRSYSFSVGAGAVTGPKTGDVTAAKVAVTGVGRSTATGVTYQWRRGDSDPWATVPAADVTVAAGGGAVAWPLPTSGSGAFPKLNWDVEATLAAVDAESVPRDGPVQVRGSFTGGAGGYSSSVKITFDRAQASAESEQIGPGSVNLLTGNYTLADTDVSVDAPGSDLTVTRSYNTRRVAQTDPAEMFGPGWVSGAVVDEADAGYTSLSVYGSLVQVGLPDGDTIGFTRRSTTAFDPEIGMEALTLSHDAVADAYTLRDLDGQVAVFTRVTGTTAGKYFPTSVTVPGDNQTVSYSWERVTVAGKEIVRPTRMLAPVADGVACTTLARGCRALTFSYATATTATGTDEPGWGDYLGRVREITFTAWDPDLATPAMRTVPMARYAYDNSGRLRASWDPRLDWNDAGTVRHVADTYTYGADGVLSATTPAGQEPWQFSYTTVPGDPGTGRLHRVTRSALAAGAATTTVVYQVPTSGTGAPYDLSPSQTARWGQTEAPTDATAVFPPDQVPGGDPATGTLPASWEHAEVTYLDANARAVNEVDPGGHTTATWYDQWGNSVRSLTAANRARALDASASDTSLQEATLAEKLSSVNSYSADGRLLLAETGPEHDVVIGSGATVRGRSVIRYTHDEGAPTTGAPYHLVTTQDELVRYWGAGGVVTETDLRRTTKAYNWTLRQPTVLTVDPGGKALTTRIGYDAETGLPNSTTLPAGGTSTTTPYTRQTVAYRATSGSGYAECDLRPEWAGLTCRTQPGGQPATGPEVPYSVTTYDLYHQPRTITEKTGAGVLRTTTTTYDGAGRVRETAVTAAAGLGAAVPVQRSNYDPATGTLTRVQSVTGGTVTAEVVRGYDRLGRQVSYTDADGNTSTTGYDLLGRVSTSSDGKATRTYRYDGVDGRRDLLTAVDDGQVGTFSGGYDADGNLVSETWPNGVVVSTEHDETGTPVGLTYTRPGCGQADCTLFSEAVTESGHGQWRRHVSTLSDQAYGYDAVGRLTSVEDTVGEQCTTRTYAFSTASNRASTTTYAPGSDGACQSTAAAGTRSWSYDTADRVTSTGYGYDALGRTTTVPAADTAVPASGNLTVAYHVTDLVDRITQGARTTDYTLDVTGNRIRSWTDNASGVAVQAVHHYDDDSDNPAWTQESAGHWTRAVTGLSALAAIWHSDSGQAEWQLRNLHGDLVASIRPGDQGLSATSESTEYGAPRNPDDAGTQRYGWLGANQRAADTPAGIVLMGVRLYNPTTGRFLQTDPVYGGNANPYDYCSGDPVNCFDLDGRFGWGKWLDRTGAVLGFAAMFGCGPCAVISAGISLGRGIYKIRKGDRSGWVDLVGVGTFGAAKALRYGGKFVKNRRIKNAPKGVPGRSKYYKKKRKQAAAKNRRYQRKVVRRADRIDTGWGVWSSYTAGRDGYRDYRSWRKKRRR